MTQAEEIQGLRAETTALRAEVAELKVQLEAVRQQAGAIRSQHDDFRGETNPVLRDLTVFQKKFEGFVRTAQVFLMVGTPALILLLGLAVSEYAAGARRDERLRGLEDRANRLQTSTDEGFKEAREALKEVRAGIKDLQERFARTEGPEKKAP